MVKEILAALESNKFVTVCFTKNGTSVQVTASARSDKGCVTPPVNLLAAPEALEDSLSKVLEGLWLKGRKENRKSKEKDEADRRKTDEPEKPDKAPDKTEKPDKAEKPDETDAASDENKEEEFEEF